MRFALQDGLEAHVSGAGGHDAGPARTQENPLVTWVL